MEIDLDVSSSKALEFLSGTSSFLMFKACCTNVIIVDSEDSIDKPLQDCQCNLVNPSNMIPPPILCPSYPLEKL